MLEQYIDKLMEEVHSALEFHQLHSNPLKYYSVQASLFSTAMKKINDKVVDYQFVSLEEEISFFKNSKPRLLTEQHYSHYKALSLKHCLNLSKDACKAYYRNEIQRIDDFFSDHNDFCTYLAIGDDHCDIDYFTRLSARSNLNVDYYLGDKDFKTTCEKGHIIGKMRSKKRLSIYFQSQLQNEPLHNTSQVLNSIKNLPWNGSSTDLVELIYALKAAGFLNDTILSISEVLSHVFGINGLDTYKTWNRIKGRKKNSTRLLSKLLEALSKQIKEENEE